MATAGEMAAFQADLTHAQFATSSDAVRAALAVYDLTDLDHNTIIDFAKVEASEHWISFMVRDRQGRLMWLAGQEGKPAISYLKSEWHGDSPQFHLAIKGSST